MGGGSASHTDSSVNFLKRPQISEDANSPGEGLKVRGLSGAAGADAEAQSRPQSRAPLGPTRGRGPQPMERDPERRLTLLINVQPANWKQKKELFDTAFAARRPGRINAPLSHFSSHLSDQTVVFSICRGEAARVCAGVYHLPIVEDTF